MFAEPNLRTRQILLLSLDDPLKKGGIGGKHVHINLLMKGLREEGKKVSLATVREDTRFKLFHRYPGAIYRRIIHDRSKRYQHYTSQYVAQLRRNLRNIHDEPSVLNPHDILSCNLASEIFSARTPLVMTLHGYYTMEAASSQEIQLNSSIYDFYLNEEKRACDVAWRIVCVDNRIRNYLITKLSSPPSRISVLPNAIDTNSFVPASFEIVRSHRETLRISDRKFVILCPRRLVPKNGVKYVVLAMACLKQEIPNALLLIAGDGPERSEIERIVKSEHLQDCVRFVGNVPHNNILRYYQACDVVVIPSITSVGVEEATSLSMLEGMACGKPVIVTNIGGLAEIVKHNETGIIVDQANPEAIAREVKKLHREPELARILGFNARKFVDRNHSYTAHAKRMITEYEKAMLDGGR